MSGDARFCPSCGAAIEPGARFCPRCGRPIPGSPGVAAGPSPTYPLIYAPEPGPVHDPGAETDFDQTRTGLLLLMIGFALGWIPYVSAIGGVCALIGIIFFWLGRRGFGDVHHRYVRLGCILVLLALLGEVIVGSLFVGVVFDAFAPTSSGSTDAASISGALEALLVGTLVCDAIGSLGYVFLPYGLADRSSRTLLWCGYVAGIVVPSVIVAILWGRIASAVSQATSGTTIDLGPVQAIQTTEILLSTLNIVPMMIYLAAYSRIRSEGPRAAEEPDR